MRFMSRAKRGNFSPKEPEAEMLDRFVRPGDWVVDIGANVGQYTLLLSGLVGRAGHVLAFEPITNTTATLASIIARYAPWQNVSIFNLAVSNEVRTLSFDLPIDSAGLYNYEMAAAKEGGGITVLAVSLDSMKLPHPISLVKIDAEGHENEILDGMRATIERDLPTLIIEDNGHLPDFLVPLGYLPEKQDGFPNVLYISPKISPNRRTNTVQ